jgi:hypothetical protein
MCGHDIEYERSLNRVEQGPGCPLVALERPLQVPLPPTPTQMLLSLGEVNVMHLVWDDVLFCTGRSASSMWTDVIRGIACVVCAFNAASSQLYR